MKFENDDEHKGKMIEVNKPNPKHKFKCLIKLKEGKIIEVDFENETRQGLGRPVCDQGAIPQR